MLSRLAIFWTPSVATPTRKAPSPSSALVAAGPRFSSRAGRYPRPTRPKAEVKLIKTFATLLGGLSAAPSSDDDWRVASIDVANGGLEARSALEHAPAAYVSGLAQTQELCTRIWPGFDEYDLDGGLMRSDVESSLGASFVPHAGIYNSSGARCQKSLSAKVEL